MDNTLLVIILLLVVALYGGVITFLYLRKRRKFNTLLHPTAQPTSFDGQNPASEDELSDAEREKYYQDKADEARLLSQTFQKFVPRQFVDHFARHGRFSLELGHADEDDVAILFCDIRGFTGLSERMPPKDLMRFLNSYFLRMNAPIHQNKGFIDKFIGDAIMALFDHPNGDLGDKARDAVQAAFDLRSTLTLYNEHRRNCVYAPVEIGIGIHAGPVIIGTVGSDDRMDTTVIGDNVNVAYRLESLTAIYNVNIVVSRQLLDALPADFPVKTRILDWVRVKGRTAPLEIYEVLQHLSLEEQTIKLQVDKNITQALAYRKQRRWDDALAELYLARDMSPDDALVAHHISICHEYREKDLPEDWDGAILQQ